VVLEQHRPRADPYLLPLARRADALGLTPDAVTVISFALAVVAGGLFFVGQAGRPALLAAGGLLVLGSALLDAVDGRLARLQGNATARGDYLDHVTDRYADLAILLGIGLAPGFDLRITIVAVVGTLLTSYMGTQAQAVGMKRIYGGLMGRADRLMLMVFVPPLQLVLVYFGWDLPTVLGQELNVPYLVVLWIALAGNVTMLQRFVSGLRQLQQGKA
jgi:archaetidylinositol phosphate synthase